MRGTEGKSNQAALFPHCDNAFGGNGSQTASADRDLRIADPTAQSVSSKVVHCS